MMPTMTREGRVKRTQSWQMGQEQGQIVQKELAEIALALGETEYQVEFWRGVGQYLSTVAHELAEDPEV